MDELHRQKSQKPNLFLGQQQIAHLSSLKEKKYFSRFILSANASLSCSSVRQMSIFLELNKDKSSKYLTWYKYNRICLKSVSFLLSEPEFSSNRFDVITWSFNFLHAWDKVHVSFGRKSNGCVFGNSRHRKFCSHNVVYSLQNMHTMHGWSCPGEKDEFIQSRMRSFHAGIHKRTFGLKRQGLCLFKKLENYATSPKLTSGRKQLQLCFGETWQNILFLKLGGKQKNWTVQNDANVKVYYSSVPDSMSLLSCLICWN